MRRFSFRVANEDEELFGDQNGGREKLQSSRASFEIVPSFLSSSSKRRRSICRNVSSVSTALSIVSIRKSFSYDKLAQAPIHLTVIKLDGSSFEIEVITMAKISDLKQAVESAFSHLPTEGPGKISWRHVWAHFCLSYSGQKLLNDVDYINSYGIRDGDELHFVRHVSIAYNLIKKRSRKRNEAPKPSTITESNKEEISEIEVADDDVENVRYQVHDNSNYNEPVLAHLFRGWFLYSRISSTEHSKFERPANSPKWTGGFVGCLKSLFPFCDDRLPSYSSRVSQVEI
ncbi:uncharacterized protein LOC130804223 [Amaranthus tricolor]|uniref:uncharacterized protein LOC130804223 n=1 Tax=Amaranthus tricolor TaxID=29722 RepID=UPI00258FC006|nr:uncharacterized protein LOC130804223 [Amaranthus tricolor]